MSAPEHNRRRFLKSTLSATALAGSSSWLANCRKAAGPAPAKPPNILMIVSDDQGFGDLS